MRTIIVPARTRVEHESGPFHIWRSYPGRFLSDTQDTGLGPLGCVDHAFLQPGLRVPMHIHKDDEIFSYVREGALTHTDSLGETFRIDARHPLMMNAGRGLAHEEHIPSDGVPVRMLQIFVRPAYAGMSPALQSGELPEAESVNQWRLIAGPASSTAPFHFRNEVHLYDITLQQTSHAPPPATTHILRWLYVFSGKIEWGSATLSAGDALLLGHEHTGVIRAKESAQLVCFHCDPCATFTRNGSLSG